MTLNAKLARAAPSGTRQRSLIEVLRDTCAAVRAIKTGRTAQAGVSGQTANPTP